MKKVWWIAIFLAFILSGGALAAQSEISLSVSANIYPESPIVVYLGARNLPGVECVLYSIEDPLQYLQEMEKKDFFRVDSWQPRRPLNEKEEWQNTKYSFFQKVRGLASRILPTSVKEFLKNLVGIHGPLPSQPIEVTPADFRRHTNQLKSFWVDLPRQGDSPYRWRNIEIAPLPPGVYLLSAKGEGREAQVLFSVTRLSALARWDGEKQLVFVQDGLCGTPQAEAEVRVIEAGQLIAEGVTDENGLWLWEDKAEKEQALIVQKGQEFAFLQLYPSYFIQEETDLFLYTDRPIYQPGQMVFGKAILREVVQDRYLAPPAREAVKVALVDFSGNQYQGYTVFSNAAGSVSFSFRLPEKVEEGFFEIKATWRGETFYRPLSVESYEKAAFEVTLTPQETVYPKGKEVVAKVEGRYYSGRPLAGGEFRYQVFRYPLFEWGKERTSQMVLEDTGQLDQVGEGEIRFLPQLEEGAYRYQIRCLVYDPASRVVEKSAQVKVLMGDFALLLKSPQYFFSEQETISYQVEARDPQETKVPVSKAYAQVYRLLWDEESQTWEETPVRLLSFSLPTGEGTIQFSLERAGYYRLEVFTQDKNGNRIVTSSTFSVVGSDFRYPAQGLELQFDQESYQVGEEARILIIPPSSEGLFTYLFSLEGPEIREFKVMETRGPKELVLPVLPEYRMGCSLLVAGFSGGEFYQEQLVLPVEAGKELEIEITSDQARYQPGQKGKILVRVLDSRGEPVECELSLSIVDQAVFDLGYFWWENIYDHFYGSFYNQVYGSSSLYTSFYGQGIPFQDMKTQFKGLGGAEEGGLVRKYFPDTLLWQAELQTDEKGQVEVDFVAPHSLTRWRVEVRAHQGDFFGEAIQSFTTYQPFALRLGLPSFLVEGDKLEGQLSLWNELDSQTVTLRGESSAHLSLELEEEELTIGKEEEKTLPFYLQAITPGESYLRLYAQGERAQDALELSLSVKERGVRVEDYLAAVFEDGKATFDFSYYSSLLASPRVRVVLFPTGRAMVQQEMAYLLEYPYGCSEQLASRIIGLSAFSLQGGWERIPEVIEAIRQDIYSLYALQSYDGGWGWGKSEASTFYHTAYVLLAFKQAEDRGFLISPQAVERGVQFIERELEAKKVNEEQKISSWELILSLAALSHWEREVSWQSLPAFTELGDRELAGLGLLLPLESKPEVERIIVERAHALGETVFFGSVNPEKPWEDDRVVATALCALFLAEQGNPLAQKAYLWLLREKEGLFWTTEERAYFLRLSSQILEEEVAKGSSSFQLFLNGEPIEEGIVGAEKEEISLPLSRLREGVNRIEIQGKGLFLAEIIIDGWQEKGETSSVFSLKQNYYRLLPLFAPRKESFFELEEAEVFQVGEEIVCEIEIESPEYLEYLIIEAGIPAGCELIKNDYFFQLPEVEGINYPWVNKVYHSGQVVLFVNRVLPGKNLIRYYLRVRDQGSFYLRAPVAYLMYFPEIRAYGEEGVFRVEK